MKRYERALITALVDAAVAGAEPKPVTVEVNFTVMAVSPREAMAFSDRIGRLAECSVVHDLDNDRFLVGDHVIVRYAGDAS